MPHEKKTDQGEPVQSESVSEPRNPLQDVDEPLTLRPKIPPVQGVKKLNAAARAAYGR